MDILIRASNIAVRDFGFDGNGARVALPSIVGALLAAALVFNRLYWRIHLVRTLGIDDLCIGLSLVFLFALAVVNLVAVNRGYGRSSNSLDPADLRLALQMFYLDQIFYKFTINLTKLSILTLYLRIFTQTWFVRTCWCLFALVTAYAIASIIATVFQCTPINFYWDRLAPPSTASGPEGEGDLAISNKPHCISTTAFWLANAVYNISTDIIILVTLPFMIWSLRLPKSQKIGLTVVFGLGVFVFATSVLRLTTLESGSTAKDPLVGTVSSTMWTMIEASTAVICACLPMCRTPLQRVWPKLFPSKYASAGGAQTQSDSPVDGSGTAGAGSPGGITGKGSLRVNMPNGMMSGPRETSGGMWAGHRGPGGRTLEDEEEFEDLEMQPVSSSKEETDRKGIIRGVVPVRMKGW